VARATEKSKPKKPRQRVSHLNYCDETEGFPARLIRLFDNLQEDMINHSYTAACAHEGEPVDDLDISDHKENESFKELGLEEYGGGITLTPDIVDQFK
jgi:hypothetical protein